MTATKVLFCSGWLPVADHISAHVRDAAVVRCGRERVPREIADAEVVIPTGMPITAALMDAAPKLKLIQQAGVGLEGVDIAAATARGIMVANVPSTVSQSAASVAELALMLMLVLARRYGEAVAELKARHWGLPMGGTLYGKTVGIVGVGGVGRALARQLGGLDVRLLGIKRTPGEELRQRLGFAWLGDPGQLDYLLGECDFVVLCASLDESTRGLIGRAQLARMKRSAFLVNVGRGALVDPEALEEALKEGRIAGAGLDVFGEEPVDPASRLLRYNVAATPHVGSVTDAAFDGVGRAVAENVRRLLAGEPVLNCVNTAALEQFSGSSSEQAPINCSGAGPVPSPPQWRGLG